MTDPHVVDWLMDGDPAIRHQVMRDLLSAPADEWRAEQDKMATEGSGAQFVSALNSDHNWPKGRWTDTLWTLQMLIDIGFPPDHPAVKSAAHRFLDRSLEKCDTPTKLRENMDLCHLGFWLRIAAYFAYDLTKLADLIAVIRELQLADGGWNCRIRNYPNTTHSSFHTTFNILEGLRQASILDRESFALEFMLQHHMYRSDKTGVIISERFTDLTYPSHWHYTVLRGLDYIRQTDAIDDPRLSDPIALIENQRKPNGRWPLGKRIPGDYLVHMEKVGGDSRWNTLRAMRTLNARRTSRS